MIWDCPKCRKRVYGKGCPTCGGMIPESDKAELAKFREFLMKRKKAVYTYQAIRRAEFNGRRIRLWLNDDNDEGLDYHDDVMIKVINLFATKVLIPSSYRAIAQSVIDSFDRIVGVEIIGADGSSGVLVTRS